MTPATIDTFGGIFTDAEAVMAPTQELSATYDNVLHEGVAQMSRTTDKRVVKFATTTTAGPVVVSTIDGRGHAGTGSGQFPTTITKTATGLYDILYAATFTDALGVVENVTFSYSSGRVKHLSTCGTVQTTEATNTIHVAVFDATGALSDLGGSITIEVDAR